MFKSGKYWWSILPVANRLTAMLLPRISSSSSSGRCSRRRITINIFGGRDTTDVWRTTLRWEGDGRWQQVRARRRRRRPTHSAVRSGDHCFDSVQIDITAWNVACNACCSCIHCNAKQNTADNWPSMQTYLEHLFTGYRFSVGLLLIPTTVAWV